MLDQAESMVVVLDPAGCVIGINRACCDVLGLSADKVTGHNWFEEFVTEFDRQNSFNCFNRMLNGEMTLGIYVENRLVTSEGTSKTLRWNNTLLRDEKGRIYGVLAFGSQAGMPQEIRKRLRKTDERFEEYEKMKSEFVIAVSHELRTPLTIFKNIISNAMAGISGKIPPKLRKDLEIASDAVDRLAGIVSGFLDISRIEAEKLQLRRAPIIIQTVVSDAVEMLLSIIKNNNMVIDFDMPQAALFVKADYDKMIQVFGKLLENAAKFVPNCGGRLVIRVIDAGNDVIIEIEDNGPGIEIDDVNRVFGKFIQIGRHVGAGEHGTGLGLTIAKELVEMHGGRVWAENILYGGAKFSILLPKCDRNGAMGPELADSEINELIASFKVQVDNLRHYCSNEDPKSKPQDSGQSTDQKILRDSIECDPKNNG